MQAYSNPERENDEHALPDIEVFQLNAHEVAAMDEDLVWEYSHKHEHRLANMNGRDREKMLDAMCEEECITGGWFYWFCFPGCLPDSEPIGPYATHNEALRAAQSENA